LRGKEIVLNTASLPKINGLTVEQTEAMMRLSCLPAFKDLVSKVQADEVSVGWVVLLHPTTWLSFLAF